MTSPAAGDDATGTPPAPGPAPEFTGDEGFDPFRFGRPDPGSPAAAAYPHLFPPAQFPAGFPTPPSPGQFPPPEPSSGYGGPPPYPQSGSPTDPGRGPSGFAPPGYAPPGYAPPGYAPDRGPSGYPPAGYGYPASIPSTEKPGNGRAVAGLVLGICSLVLFFLNFLDIPLVILGIVFSSRGLRASREGKGQRSLAVAGLVVSILAAVLVVTVCIVLLHQVHYCQQRHDQGTRAYNECIVHF